jgi:hypothetical protein
MNLNRTMGLTGIVVAAAMLTMGVVGCGDDVIVVIEVMTDSQYEQITAEGAEGGGEASTIKDLKAIAPEAVAESIGMQEVDTAATNPSAGEGGQRSDGQVLLETAETRSYVIQCWSVDRKVLYQFYMHGNTVSKKERIEIAGD